MLSPWIVQVVFSSFDQQDLQIVVKIGKPASRHATSAASTTHDNVNFIRDGHFEDCWKRTLLGLEMGKKLSKTVGWVAVSFENMRGQQNSFI